MRMVNASCCDNMLHSSQDECFLPSKSCTAVKAVKLDESWMCTSNSSILRGKKERKKESSYWCDTFFIISSPFWFIVELITKALDTIPVSVLIQGVGGLVCVKGKFISDLTFSNNKKHESPVIL